MEEILRFLYSNAIFLFRDYNFKFIDSEWSPSFGGSAYVILTNGFVKIRFVKSRDGLLMEFQPSGKIKAEWFQFTIVGIFLTNDFHFSGDVNKNNAVFLKGQLPKIMEMFSENNIKQTIQELNLIKREMSKRLFPPRRR